MNDYISGNSITDKISTLQFFPLNYFNTYIKNFTSKNNLIYENINNTIEPLIFITKVEYLNDFYNKIVSSINTRFVLITHYGDKEAGLHTKILNHPLLIKWYGQNMRIISDKTLPIPIGLESCYFKRTNTSILKLHSNNPKKNLLYLNFSLHTNPNRRKIMNCLLEKGFIKNEKLDWDNYIKDLSTYKFCISPKGNGVDCHRTWECLYLGVIPIVEKSDHMNYFNDLPILFVDNYDIISVEYLNRVYDDFKSKTFNKEKMFLHYWNRKIGEHFEY